MKACTINNCNKVILCKDVCSAHYYQLYRKDYYKNRYLKNKDKLLEYYNRPEVKIKHTNNVKKYNNTEKGRIVRLKQLKNYRSTENGKKIRLFLQRKREAAKLKRIPLWADLKAIKEFYKNCPVGYEVDHIIPLQGKNVSGLHILENLQYLTKSENRKKWNKYE